jgi:hypothetical protein
VALSAERLAEWIAADLSQLDLLAIQIDGVHITDDLTLLAAVGIDGEGVKHPLGCWKEQPRTLPWCRHCSTI